ncbi:unnamed protein product [Prorocentrum cordatum]|uniref:Uncharacterized protein n=1 Tax=Prorocentrum cordatum TaxID=2364126 RepID=A0ABN9PXZ9_9DINO|nr:unnamed protein product [Polarella glacialis]
MKERERERESAEGKMAMRAEGSVRGSLHSAAGRRGGMGGGGEESFAGGGRKYETGEQRRNMSRAQLAEPLDALEKWYGRRQAGRCCRCRRGPPGLKAAAAVPGGGEAGTEQHAPSARAGAPAARLRPQGGGGAAPGASPFGCRTGQLPTALPEPSPCGGPPGGRAG